VLADWSGVDELAFANASPIAVVATWALAVATGWIGRLRMSRQYWIYTGLAGLATGLGFWGAGLLDAPGQFLNFVADLNPFWTWPTLTCIAIYYGRSMSECKPT
jgi:hypothetical protein